MNIISAFSTPIWESTHPDFSAHQQNFIDCTKNAETNNPNPEQKFFLNGYQSPRNILQHQEPLFPLFDYAIQTAEKSTIDLSFVPSRCFISSAWVNIARSESAVLFNTTQRETFTGLMFLKAPLESGKLFISNPGTNTSWQGNMLIEHKNKFNSEKMHIQPAEGQLFVFPSYLSYGIEPNNHDEETICVVMSIIAIPEEAWNEQQNS